MDRFIEIDYLSHRPGMGSRVRIIRRCHPVGVICEGVVTGIDAYWHETEDEDGDAMSFFAITSIAVETATGETKVHTPEDDLACIRVLDGPYYANLYLVQQAYGGPEEGGWWYNAGVPEDCYRFDDYDAARRWMADTGEDILARLNEGRRPLHSVLSDGRYEFRLENHLPRPYPQRRPHYS